MQYELGAANESARFHPFRAMAARNGAQWGKPSKYMQALRQAQVWSASDSTLPRIGPGCAPALQDNSQNVGMNIPSSGTASQNRVVRFRDRPEFPDHTELVWRLWLVVAWFVFLFVWSVPPGLWTTCDADKPRLLVAILGTVLSPTSILVSAAVIVFILTVRLEPRSPY